MLSLLALLALLALSPTSDQPDPVRVAVVGLTHTHVHWILGREDRGDIEIVGIWEPNEDLAGRYIEQHGLSPDLYYGDLDTMLDETEPEAVTVFTSIYEHLEVVEQVAPRGIHIMVEKPLAVSMDHALRMAELAKTHGVHLLTNYETTWYPSVHRTRAMVEAGELGPMRKMVIRDGHRGPKEIGVNEEFLEWLTDPVLNGGGAITDFGCYGANIATWLMEGQRPQTVFAVTQTHKPDIYPHVDDEATIVLTYPGAQAIIQASWNWPVSRKDMAVYGRDAYVYADDGSRMRTRAGDDEPEHTFSADPADAPVDDPFAYLALVVRGELDPAQDLNSLPINLIVMEILDAARESARTGSAIRLAD